MFTAAADGTITILDAAQLAARSRAWTRARKLSSGAAGSGEW